MNQTQQAIIDYLRRTPQATAREIAGALGYSQFPVHDYLRQWQRQGAVIIRRARGQATRYRLNPRWF